MKVVPTFHRMRDPVIEFKSSVFAVNTFYLWSYHRRFLSWKPHLCVCVCVHMCTHTCSIYGGQRSEVKGQPQVFLFRCCPSIPDKALTGLELAKMVRQAGWLANESQRIYWLSQQSLVHDILPNFLCAFRDGI